MKRIVALVLTIGALGAVPGTALAQGPPPWAQGPPSSVPPDNSASWHACSYGPGLAPFC
jgi:hypothetical protein